MNIVVKQVIGVAFRQRELVASMASYLSDQTEQFGRRRVFNNSRKGWYALYNWAHKYSCEAITPWFVLEDDVEMLQTLWEYLAGKGQLIGLATQDSLVAFCKKRRDGVVLGWGKADWLAMYGLGTELEPLKYTWPLFQAWGQLLAEKEEIVHYRSRVVLQFNAELSEAFPNKESLKRTRQRITLLKRQEERINLEMKKAIAKIWAPHPPKYVGS